MIQRGGQLLCSIVLLCLLGCKEAAYMRFDNVTAIKEARAIEKGWIPDIIPPDATRISVSGDSDTGNVFGSYLSKNGSLFESKCSRLADASKIPDYATRHLQHVVKQAFDVSVLSRSGYIVYRCDAGKFEVAVQSSGDHIYYWNAHNM